MIEPNQGWQEWMRQEEDRHIDCVAENYPNSLFISFPNIEGKDRVKKKDGRKR